MDQKTIDLIIGHLDDQESYFRGLENTTRLYRSGGQYLEEAERMNGKIRILVEQERDRVIDLSLSTDDCSDDGLTEEDEEALFKEWCEDCQERPWDDFSIYPPESEKD